MGSIIEIKGVGEGNAERKREGDRKRETEIQREKGEEEEERYISGILSFKECCLSLGKCDVGRDELCQVLKVPGLACLDANTHYIHV